jgi:hypothetical protein
MLDLSRTFYNSTGGLFYNVFWPDILARVNRTYANAGAAPVTCSANGV